MYFISCCYLAHAQDLNSLDLSVYGQLVLLPTRTESTRTFSLVNSFFATRTLVNSYLFFGQLELSKKITYDMLCYFIMALLVP